MSPTPSGATEEGVDHRQQMHRRVVQEIEVAAGLLGVSEAELCRKAGYNPTYMTTVRGSIEKGHGPTLRFLADLEKTWGIKFEVTVLHRPKGGPT